MIDESSSQCFKCQGYGHVAAHCPFRNFLVRAVDGNEIETIVYEPTGSATDSDDDVRVSSIQLGVFRCSHTTTRDQGWRRSCVFHTYFTHEENNYKLIDRGSCANIIAKTALEKMGL